MASFKNFRKSIQQVNLQANYLHATGDLSETPVPNLGFQHGERTADLGRLGNTSGVTQLEYMPDSNMSGNARWLLNRPGFDPQIYRDIDNPNSADTLEVYAGRPGIYKVEARNMQQSSNGEVIGGAVISVPWFFHIKISQSLKTMLNSLVSSVGNSSRDSIVQEIKKVTHHILRPANVRLIWEDLGETLPLQFDAQAAPSASNPFVAGLEEIPDSLGGCASDWLNSITLNHSAGGENVNAYSRKERDTGYQLKGNADTILIGNSLTPILDSGQALKPVQDHLANLESDQNFDDIIERGARWIGVAIARCALEQMGKAENSSPGASITGTDNIPDINQYDNGAISDIMDAEPTDPERLLLGITVDSSGDVTDLIEEYRSNWGLSGNKLTALDLLAGIVGVNNTLVGQTLGTLQFVERQAPLAPTYAGWRLRPGDNDSDHTYQGSRRTTQAALPNSGEPDFISLLQQDLRGVGILLPPDNTQGSMEGGQDRDEQLHTEWAIRELQIAMQYPYVALDQFRNNDCYGKNLMQYPNDERGIHHLSKNKAVTGVLDWYTARALRRWRFQRLRHPVIIEAREDGSSDFDTIWADASGNTYDNVWDAQAIDSIQPRIFARDLSGFTDVSPDQSNLMLHTLGDTPQDAGGAEGPRMTRSHGQVPVVPQNYRDDVANFTELNADERSVYKVIAAAAFRESLMHFDIINAYDNQIISHPLFHYIYGGTNGNGAGAGEGAGFLAYLRHTNSDLYDKYHASCGVWPSRIFGRKTLTGNQDTGDGAAEDDKYTWDSQYKHVGKVVVLSRDTPAGDALAGKLTNRPFETDADQREYMEWFRNWHWVKRILFSLRENTELRRLTYDFAVRRLVDLMGTEIDTTGDGNGDTVVRDIVDSEVEALTLLREHIKAPGHFEDMALAAHNTNDNTPEGRMQAMHDSLPNDDSELRVRKAIYWYPNYEAGAQSDELSYDMTNTEFDNNMGSYSITFDYEWTLTADDLDRDGDDELNAGCVGQLLSDNDVTIRQNGRVVGAAGVSAGDVVDVSCTIDTRLSTNANSLPNLNSLRNIAPGFPDSLPQNSANEIIPVEQVVDVFAP